MRKKTKFLRAVQSMAIIAFIAIIGLYTFGCEPEEENQPVPFLARQVSAGRGHTAAIKTDGSLWAWGDNGNGQLGDGTITTYEYQSNGVNGEYIVDNNNKNTPTRIGTETNWASVSAGYEHTMAIKTDGSLWAWGRNDCGQLGDGSFTDRSTPTRIGIETNWASVSAGSDYTIAIKTDGSLWAWSRNNRWQLADDTITNRSAPAQIGAETNWASVSAEGDRSIAIKKDGSLWAWSYGYNYTTLQNVPTRIGTETNWASVYDGGDYTMAIKKDASLWAWGSNYYGQLGDGTGGEKNNRHDKRTPTQIFMKE